LLLQVAGVCGVRNTPPGSAAIRLLARLDNLEPWHVDDVLGTAGDLVEVLGVRASPLPVPRADVAVFTIGALPRTDAGLQAGACGA
jgi:hypothetical protein